MTLKSPEKLRKRFDIKVHRRDEINSKIDEWAEWFESRRRPLLSQHPRWMSVFQKGLKQTPFCIESRQQGACSALLPLMYLKSPLFGSHLVSLPYLNSSGVIEGGVEESFHVAEAATELADQLGVRHLQIRQESLIDHPRLSRSATSKVNMRLALTESVAELWDGFRPKVRNQVRKAEKLGVSLQWGRHDVLSEFYRVFSRNMRDLGTPVFGIGLFKSILETFPDNSEICVAQHEGNVIAGAILLHGDAITEVPSASSLREHNWTNANMFMYWGLLRRAIERKQGTFDFGRSSPHSSTHRFKKQWGATPSEAIWQYYIRRGDTSDLRLESGRFRVAVELWKRLPVAVTLAIGPKIVRGIP